MDIVTGAQATVAVTVQLPRVRMWELVTAVDRIGEWSPEATGASWEDDARGAVAGARFVAHNRYAKGFVSTVTCVVIEADRPKTFAWTVLDSSGLVGSAWRYELRDGDEPGTTVVHQTFTHGPGITGARERAEADPAALERRLDTLRRNMTATIRAMVTTDTTMGATR